MAVLGPQPDLLHDAFLIIVSQRAAQLVVIHGWPVLLDAPEPGNLGTRDKSIWVEIASWRKNGGQGGKNT